MIHKMITVLVTLLLMALLPPVIALTWWTWHRPDPIKIIERVAYYKKGRLFTSVTMVAHDLCIFTTEPQIINDRVVVLPPSDPRQMTQLGEITRNQIFIIDLDEPGPHEFIVTQKFWCNPVQRALNWPIPITHTPSPFEVAQAE